jgi:phage head-tail adaptor, putative, SPP1 family
MGLNDLNKRITIQRAIESRDTEGNIVETYADMLSCWACVEPYGAKIIYGEAEKISEITYQITMRYRPNILQTDRIIYQGRNFLQNLAPINLNSKNELLRLDCREVVDDG